MYLNQIGRGFVLVTVLGSLVLLGSACSPVSSSISKVPHRGNKLIDRNGNTDGESRVTGKAFVVASHQTSDALASIPGSHNLKEYPLAANQRSDLKQKSYTTVSFPEFTGGSVQIYTVIEVSLSSEKIEEQKLNEIKVIWTQVPNSLNDFILTIVDDEKSNSKRNEVRKNLSDITLSYRTLE